MRVVRVITNESCNQHCRYCSSRRPVERASFVRDAALRVAEAVKQAPAELVLAGGEPTLRRDLSELVRAAAQGIEGSAEGARVVLETNAAVVDAPMAGALRAAGLALARVKIPAWGAAYDSLTQDEGAFHAMLAGIAALIGQGIPVEAMIPVVRANLELVEGLPDALRGAGIDVAALVVSVPHRAGEHPDALAPLPLATGAVEHLVAASRRSGLEVRSDPAAFPPPCLFSSPARVSDLFTLTPGGGERQGFRHVPGCESCIVRGACPGFPEESLGRGEVAVASPLREDRLRRRLTRIASDREQIERELVTREVHRTLDGITRAVHTVRVVFRCNQSCGFCFVSTHLPGASDAAVVAAIEAAGAEGADLALSGGEPTLNPRLAEYVRVARRAGVREVELQTNATRLGDPALVAELEAAGVDVAFVSLHGSTGAISDAITRAPGTFDQTVAGIDCLTKSRIRVRLNFVHCALNAADFRSYVTMVAARWPGVTLTFSFVAPSTDLVPVTPELVPRYSDVRPVLAEGIALARSLGLTVTGFESMCSIPLCLLPAEVREYLTLPSVPDGVDRGEFTRVSACERCRVKDACWGVRRRYLELHGDGEFAPIP